MQVRVSSMCSTYLAGWLGWYGRELKYRYGYPPPTPLLAATWAFAPLRYTDEIWRVLATYLPHDITYYYLIPSGHCIVQILTIISCQNLVISCKRITGNEVQGMRIWFSDFEWQILSKIKNCRHIVFWRRITKSRFCDGFGRISIADTFAKTKDLGDNDSWDKS